MLTTTVDYGGYRRPIFPGAEGAVLFEPEELVWRCQGENLTIPWRDIRSVTTSHQGATVHYGEDSLLIPTDVVWYELVVEDIIEEARAAIPDYEGPIPVPKPRSLEIPEDHNEQMDYTRRAQRFYKDRCPTYEEFKTFLQANLDWVFKQLLRMLHVDVFGLPGGRGLQHRSRDSEK